MPGLRQFARCSLAAAFIVSAIGLAAPAPAVLAGDGPPPPPPPYPTGSPPGCGAATVDAFQGGITPIVDSGTITSTLTVSGAGTYLWDLNLTTYIVHTRPQDLEMYLISPAGTIVTLSTDNGGNIANAFNGTVWDDQAGETNAPGPVTDNVFSLGVVETPLVPEEAMGAFQGENPNGIWSLVISDDSAGEVGSLNGWSLGVTALAQTPAVYNVTSSAEPMHFLTDVGTYTSSLYLGYLHGPVGQLKLTTNITHSRPSDLDVFLVTPGGISITISSGSGGTAVNGLAGTTWFDAAGAANPPGPVTDNVFTSGIPETPLVPEEALAAANGGLANGTWSLVVTDKVLNTIAGTLADWSLSVTTLTCLPDLLVENYTDLQYPNLESPLTYNLAIRNLGALATSLVLTDAIPAPARFVSVSAAGWACTTPPAGSYGGPLVCNGPNLDNGGTLTLTVRLLTPSASQSFTPTITVASAAEDLYPPDNLSANASAAWAHSNNGNPWDVQAAAITFGFPQDGGGLNDGGQDAFDTWGQLRLRVLDAGTVLTETGELGGFGLVYTPGHRWYSTTPVTIDTLQIGRKLYAPPGTDWLRYVDSFTNVGGAARQVLVDWGGNLGSDSYTGLDSTSSGDLALTSLDTWALTVERSDPSDPSLPATDPPVAYVLRAPTDTTYQGAYDFRATPITTTWPITGNDDLGHVFALNLAPGQTLRLAYFVYRGLSETEPGPADCEVLTNCVTPAAGTQVALARATAQALAADPVFADLSCLERATLANWPSAALDCRLFLPGIQRP